MKYNPIRCYVTTLRITTTPGKQTSAPRNENPLDYTIDCVIYQGMYKDNAHADC